MPWCSSRHASRPSQRAHGVLRKFLRAEGRVGRDTDGVAAGARDHVVDRRNFQAHDGEDRRIGRVGMDHRVDFGPGPQDVEVKSPLARRPLGGIVRAIQAHEHDLLGLHRLVGRAGRRDQQALAVAQADISRRSLVDAERIHAAAGVDDRLALFPVLLGRHFKTLLQPRDNA